MKTWFFFTNLRSSIKIHPEINLKINLHPAFMANTNYPSATLKTSPRLRKAALERIYLSAYSQQSPWTWGYLLWDKNKSAENLQVLPGQSDRFLSRDSLDAMLKVKK